MNPLPSASGPISPGDSKPFDRVIDRTNASAPTTTPPSISTSGWKYNTNSPLSTARRNCDNRVSFRVVAVESTVVDRDILVSRLREVHRDVSMLQQDVAGVAMRRPHRDTRARLDGQ